MRNIVFRIHRKIQAFIQITFDFFINSKRTAYVNSVAFSVIAIMIWMWCFLSLLHYSKATEIVNSFFDCKLNEDHFKIRTKETKWQWCCIHTANESVFCSFSLIIWNHVEWISFNEMDKSFIMANKLVSILLIIMNPARLQSNFNRIVIKMTIDACFGAA